MQSSILTSFSANLEEIKWSDDATLYQPYEVEQIILPERANCLAVKCLLNMCKLKYRVEPRTNAVDMSPTGQVPFLRLEPHLFGGVEPIANFLRNKIVSLSAHLGNAEMADMKAYMSLIKIVFCNAELLISWHDKATFNQITKPRFAKFLPWPINHFICWEQQWDVKKKLKAMDWHNKTKHDVYEEVNNCCHSLCEKLGSKDYFFGDNPTELDALAFGHLYAILSTPLPDNKLSSIVRDYQNLVDLCKRIDARFFQQKPVDVEVEEDAVLVPEN